MLLEPLGLSFTASVDGGSPTDHHFFYNIVETGDVTMLSITSLSLGSHTLLVTLLDTNPTSGSFLVFDYAFVNSTEPTASIGPLSNIHPSTTSAVNHFAKSTSR